MAGKTIAEHLAGLKATRESLEAKMNATAQKSIDEDRTTNTAEREELTELKSQIETIDSDIKLYAGMEARAAATATPVTTKAQEEAPARTHFNGPTLKTVEKLEPGIAFARYAMCLGNAGGDHAKAFRLAEKHYPQTESVVKTLKFQAEGADLREMFKQKATIPAGTTTDSTWAAPLVVAQNWGGDFVEYLRPRTLIGQAQFRPVPFNVSIGGQTSGGSSRWVGEGKAKPVTKFDFIRYTTLYTKIAALTTATKELLRLSDPAAETLLRDGLVDAAIERIDSDLFDPDIAAVSGVNPAGLLNGVSPVAGPSGTDPDDFQCAIDRLWAPWDSTFMGARPAYYTTPAVARRLAGLRDALGNRAYPNMSNTGGNIDGVPVRVSQYLANNGGSGGAPFVLVDEAEIWLADDGSVTLDFSDHATIEMSDTPVGSSSATVTSGGSPFVSMFQTNSRAFLAERAIWWGKRRTGAVQWIDGMPTSC
jgi:HK97 family phage major capsid protein